jgi:phospholipid-translocating ATPase
VAFQHLHQHHGTSFLNILRIPTPEDAYLNTHANSTRSVPSSSLRVGDLVLLEKNQLERVPADLVLLRTSESSGTCFKFIRTDQFDGETDWKQRVAFAECQN